MTLVGVALVVAVLLGVARGHSLPALAARPPHGLRLVVLAAAAQLLGGLVGGAAYPVGLMVSALLVAMFLLRNRSRAGLPLVAVGLALNAAAVLVNGAMPVSTAAAQHVGVTVPIDVRHEPAGASTRLRALTDVLPVPLPPRPEVASIGDVLVAVGLGLYLFHGTRRRPGRRGRSRRYRASAGRSRRYAASGGRG